MLLKPQAQQDSKVFKGVSSLAVKQIARFWVLTPAPIKCPVLRFYPELFS